MASKIDTKMGGHFDKLTTDIVSFNPLWLTAIFFTYFVFLIAALSDGQATAFEALIMSLLGGSTMIVHLWCTFSIFRTQAKYVNNEPLNRVERLDRFMLVESIGLTLCWLAISVRVGALDPTAAEWAQKNVLIDFIGAAFILGFFFIIWTAAAQLTRESHGVSNYGWQFLMEFLSIYFLPITNFWVVKRHMARLRLAQR